MNASSTALPQPSAAPGRNALEMFRSGRFVRLWLAGSIGSMMRWFETLAIGVYVYNISDSAFLVAIFLLLRWMPLVLFGIGMGVAADRISRRLMMVVGLSIMSVISATLGTLAASGVLELWHIAAAAFCGGTYTSSDYSTRRALIGEVAGPLRIGTAMALDACTNNGTRMFGPAIGGLVLMLGGIGGVFMLGAIVYAIAAFIMFGFRENPKPPPGPATKVLANIAEGFRYVGGQPMIITVLSVTALVNMFAFPFASVLPVIGRDTLELNPFLVGILAACEGMGAFLGAVCIAATVGPSRHTAVFLGGSALFLTGILIFALSPWLVLSFAALFFAGIGVSGFSSMQTTLLITNTDPAVRGRMLGLLAVCIGMMPFGILYTGILAETLNAAAGLALVVLHGLTALAVAITYWSRKVYRSDTADAAVGMVGSVGTDTVTRTRVGARAGPADAEPGPA